MSCQRYKNRTFYTFCFVQKQNSLCWIFWVVPRKRIKWTEQWTRAAGDCKNRVCADFTTLSRIPLGSSRLDTTRYLAHALWQREESWWDVTRRVALVARHDTLVTTRPTGTTRTTCVQRRRHSGDWGGHGHLTFSKSCSRDWCKSRAQKTKLVRASTNSSSAMLERARLNILDTFDTSRMSCRDVTWRAKWNSGLYHEERTKRERKSQQNCSHLIAVRSLTKRPSAYRYTKARNLFGSGRDRKSPAKTQ